MKIFGSMKEMMTRAHWIIFWIVGCPLIALSQDEIYQFFHLDSVVIEATKNELDIKSFVQYMIDDKSFYKAFKNLRTASYSFTNHVSVFKNEKETATYTSMAQQKYSAPCRSMEENNKLITGDILDLNGNYKYFTMKLYDRLFFTHGRYCDSFQNAVVQPSSRMERYITELKTLIFDPGSETHIPLMGAKTNIFDPDMTKYYDYALLSSKLDGKDCYLFKIEVKKAYQARKEGKTVVKKIMTWFEKENKQIIKREYELQSNTLAYSFDVHMDVDIALKNNIYYPSEITYDGSFKIIGKKRENAKFKLRVSEFN